MQERLMMVLALDFVSLMLAALLVGAMFAVCLVFNPTGLDAKTYVRQQQWGIHTLHPVMPVLGVMTALAILAAAFLSRDDKSHLTLLLAAAGLFIASGIITRLLSMPINATVLTWSAQAPPADWGQLRDTWWRWHMMRLGAGLLGLCLLILAVLRPHA